MSITGIVTASVSIFLLHMTHGRTSDVITRARTRCTSDVRYFCQAYGRCAAVRKMQYIGICYTVLNL